MKAKLVEQRIQDIAGCYCGLLCRSDIRRVGHERSWSTVRRCLTKSTMVDICPLKNRLLTRKVAMYYVSPSTAAAAARETAAKYQKFYFNVKEFLS